MPKDVTGRAAMVRLDGESLLIEALAQRGRSREARPPRLPGVEALPGGVAVVRGLEAHLAAEDAGGAVAVVEEAAAGGAAAVPVQVHIILSLAIGMAALNSVHIALPPGGATAWEQGRRV